MAVRVRGKKTDDGHCNSYAYAKSRKVGCVRLTRVRLTWDNCGLRAVSRGLWGGGGGRDRTFVAQDAPRRSTHTIHRSVKRPPPHQRPLDTARKPQLSQVNLTNSPINSQINPTLSTLRLLTPTEDHTRRSPGRCPLTHRRRHPEAHSNTARKPGSA